MGVFFGTDGLRGKFNDDLSFKVAYDLGNALGSELSCEKIIIGRDTRSSGPLLTLAFASGAMNAGASVIDVGVCPTAGISYLTKKLHFDFGVVISASHNPAEFNGIKIFDSSGKKISEAKEENLERKFIKQVSVNFMEVGKFDYKSSLINHYLKFLMNAFSFDLTGKTIILDCSNGASSFIARKIFKSKGATVFSIGSSPDGLNINKNCGSLNVTGLQKLVIKKQADFGFAFDGDSDRLIAVDEKGQILTGDMLVYIFAKFYKQQGKLSPPIVVGTGHTNMGVEKALEKNGIRLIRTEIGDKFVSLKLTELGLLIGGEQSGHIILKEFLPTGDGLLSALMLSYICVSDNKKLSQYLDFEMYSQVNINVPVKNKMELINSERLSKIRKQKEDELAGNGKIMIRVSGTEPCIRIMVETKNESISEKIANEIALEVKQIDGEFKICVE